MKKNESTPITIRISAEKAEYLNERFGKTATGANVAVDLFCSLSEEKIIKYLHDEASGTYSDLESIRTVVKSFEALYFSCIREDLKDLFSKNELLLMIDVMNGTMLTPGSSGHQISANVEDGIALDRLDEKWEIDKTAIIKKLSGLSLFQKTALELWTKKFWIQTETEGAIDIEAYAEQLSPIDVTHHR